MAPIFRKRLRCFYCGQRSPQTESGPVRKWHCKHCEAVNYLDEKGEITDPPADETNPEVYGPGASSPPFESVDFVDSGLFCSKCLRNQHLFTSALASYFPSPDDPAYSAYEREYPKFRKNLEERYPQVCENCESRVKARIRQAGYEAKADHLRRMMDRSKTGRAARKARNRNWRSLLVFAGAVCYWGSIAGQLAWNLLGALDGERVVVDEQHWLSISSLASCTKQAIETRQVGSHCSSGLTPYAGIALVLGILSLWWNPRLRMKVEGRTGRFVGLGEYYKVQLIVMVMRFVAWAVLKDPLMSGMQPTLPPTLHAFMMAFTILSVIVSRRIISYDTRPLALWSDNTPTTSPNQKPTTTSTLQSTGGKKSDAFGSLDSQLRAPRFPLEKLAAPRPTTEKGPVIPPTPPPEGEDMDWTPSLQPEIRPTISVHQRDQKSVFEGSSPFYGALPPAPKPPAWQLRNPTPQRLVEQVIEPNPFHRTPTQSQNQWGTGREMAREGVSDPVFAPPKFFPPSDHGATTGLETLFDQAFTIKSPEDEDSQDWQSTSNLTLFTPAKNNSSILFPCLRLGLLIVSIVAWLLAQADRIPIPGNYVEIASLGSASLIAGFALLETLKRPMAQWNGMEILVSVAELLAAVHLGGNLPRISFERQYFDRYGKSLLIFMVVQEALGLFSSQTAQRGAETQPQPTASSHPVHDAGHHGGENAAGNQISQSFSTQASVPSSLPSLSFSSSTVGSTTSSQASEPRPLSSSFSNYGPGVNPSLNSQLFNRASFNGNDINDNESDITDPLGPDSDTETTITTATTATTATNRAIRNLRLFSVENSPRGLKRQSDFGQGLSGLSLEDANSNPYRRTTRSQTLRQRQANLRYPLRGT
ncbi:hypothetical protein VTN02DRAFT_2378 [Thermoascus thermophilus]